MKRLLLALTPLLLVGCTLLSQEKAPEPITVDTFTIESGDTGLILKNTVDPNFENVLSTHPILEASIKDGILTFTENIDSVPITQAVNLDSFVKFLNTKKEEPQK